MDGLEISVVIPTYNRRILLRRAIHSVLAALRAGDEIIVVDDESTDGTEQVVRAMGPPVQYVRQSHGGVARARNRGLREATRPFVAFLDSDDEWMADKLQLQRQVMQRWPQVVFCFSDLGQRRVDGREDLRWLRQWTGQARPWQELFGPAVAFSSFAPLPPGRADFNVHVGLAYHALFDWPYAWVQAALVRRSLAAPAFRFPEDQPFYDDWEFLAGLSRLGDAAFLDCSTFWQCEHTGPRETDTAQHVRAACRLRMLSRIWGNDPQFLHTHRPLFDRALAHQHLILGRRALAEGRLPDARAELQQAGPGLLARTLCLVASLPPALIQPLYAAKRRFGRTPASSSPRTACTPRSLETHAETPPGDVPVSQQADHCTRSSHASFQNR